MNWLKKLIPGYIEIRSLYWVEYDKIMGNKLHHIYNQIDNGNYELAEKLVKSFQEEYQQIKVPNWVGLNMASIHGAISMLNFLKNE